MAERIALETTIIQNIPVLTLAPSSAQNCPIVFFIPGFGGNKEAGLSIGYQLARRGFFCVAFDPWLHGERYDQRIEHAAQSDEVVFIRPKLAWIPSCYFTGSFSTVGWMFRR